MSTLNSCVTPRNLHLVEIMSREYAKKNSFCSGWFNIVFLNLSLLFIFQNHQIYTVNTHQGYASVHYRIFPILFKTILSSLLSLFYLSITIVLIQPFELLAICLLNEHFIKMM